MYRGNKGKNRANRSRSHSSSTRETRARSDQNNQPKYVREIIEHFKETVETFSRVYGTAVHQESESAIPTFDPREPHQSVEMWIGKVEKLKQIHGWNDATTSLLAISRLRGLAQRRYDNLRSVALTWPEWKEKLTVEFRDRTEAPVRFERMLERKKRSDEDMMQYYEDKAALVVMCNVSGRSAVECIAHGIDDEEIQEAIRDGDIQDPKELRGFLEHYKLRDGKENEDGNKQGTKRQLLKKEIGK